MIWYAATVCLSRSGITGLCGQRRSGGCQVFVTLIAPTSVLIWIRCADAASRCTDTSEAPTPASASTAYAVPLGSRTSTAPNWVETLTDVGGSTNSSDVAPACVVTVTSSPARRLASTTPASVVTVTLP